jgi:hypothetical protein
MYQARLTTRKCGKFGTEMKKKKKKKKKKKNMWEVQ